MESVMRRIYQLSMLCLAAGVANACKPEENFTSPVIPTAGIRFLNVVPDTGAMDLRAVDIVENSASYNIGFRGTSQAYYRNSEAGSRHFRIFMSVANFDPTLTAEQQVAIASTVMKDTTVTLEAGHRYTFILWGFSRTGSTPGMKLDVIDDNPSDPGAQVALRLVNAAAGRGALDGRQYPSAGAPGAVTWAAVPQLSASNYVSAPAGAIKYNVTPAGGGAGLFADATALAGSAATVDLDALPGTTVAGSAVSGFVVSGSVIGSKATAFVSTTLAADSILVSAGASAYQRTAGSFVTQGFLVGDTVTTSGFTNAQNNGKSVVTAVTALSLTVSKVGGLVDEAKNRSRIVQTPRAGIIFLWDRRPPRPAGI
jgi:hypothetical protein